MKRVTSVLACLALAWSGLIVATGSAQASPVPSKDHWPGHGHHQPPSYNPPPIEWGTCASPRMVSAGAKCGLLTVPLDYDRPRGPKIKIGVSMLKHWGNDADYQGIMLVNPGGPGGSGLNLARLGLFVPNDGGADYDWIGFDPRGIGTSQPKLTCDNSYFEPTRPDYRPFTRSIERAWLAKAAGYSEACANSEAARAGLLDNDKTTDTVKDMETIRKAFAQPQINMYGFSYGTYLGQVYATLFPKQVRRMVWDGVVDPTDVWYRANLNQDVAFERTFTEFLGYMARHNDVFDAGSTAEEVRANWETLLEKSVQAPLGGTIGPSELTDAFLGDGYYRYGWADDAKVLAAAFHGDYSALPDQYAAANGSDDNGYAGYLAVQCTDTQWPTNWNLWRADNWRVYRTAPFETWANAWFNAPCMTWPGDADRKPVRVKDRGIPPVLLIAETLDAATPYDGALTVRQIFKKSVLIEGVGGTTHSGSLSGIECTDNRVAAYLKSGTLDPRVRGVRSDVQCDPVPEPDPAPANGRMLKKAATQGADAEVRAVIRNAG